MISAGRQKIDNVYAHVFAPEAYSLTYTFRQTRLPAARASAAAAIALFAAVPAQAQGQRELVTLINAYRAAPQACNGRRAAPVPPLAPQRALAGVRVATGALLDQVLEQNGYPVARAEAIHVTGPEDAQAVMALIGPAYCTTLLNPMFSAIGAGRTANTWLIILAQPALPPAVDRLAGPEHAGKVVLAAVNNARATARSCGGQYYAAAPALSWNGALSDAALGHSRDMAVNRYFSHHGKDGRSVSDRVLSAGYRWRRIGENIAAGQSSPEEVVAGWLASPGHCANIMNGTFTQMGAAYAINRGRPEARAYWTQVFGTPR